MAYDDKLAERVSRAFEKQGTSFTTKKMMGGLCFLVDDKMCVGVDQARLMVRIDPDDYEAALKRPGCRPMDFTGRPLKGFVYVSDSEIKGAKSLASWIKLALDYNPRAKRSKKRAPKKQPARKGSRRSLPEENTASFSGFPKNALPFLRDLERNNSRDWFSAHKQTFRDTVESPSKALAEAVAQRLTTRLGTTVSSKIFRIHRDVRFSKDKTPYNPFIRMLFKPAPKSPKAMDEVGFYLSLEPRQLVAGCGTFEFSKTYLTAYRNAVTNSKKGPALESILADLTQAGARMDEPELKRVPREFSPDAERADLLRRKGLAIWLDDGISAKRLGSDLPEDLEMIYQQFVPLYKWLAAL